MKFGDDWNVDVSRPLSCYQNFQQGNTPIMKMLLAAFTFATLMGPALAQSSQNPSAQPNQQANTQSSSQHGLIAAQKIKQDLQKEGFTDVKVVAESFVVQGKSPDGDPVVMTIGPHGMSVFEAMNEGGSGSRTTGSSNSSPSHSNSSSTSKPPASPGMQK
ncbi:hypothetical protein [Bradyrhizobium sp.]|uniref:hypothetical protein n=1 Tax=Bradyrhizobium sp. TaxID=376 RepID=UPI002382668F|nr:hypothetical protein [Bradyrhizobium sp.]MDE1932509.1 hypothetical protein [Bradyrhizobium sp.]